MKGHKLIRRGESFDTEKNIKMGWGLINLLEEMSPAEGNEDMAKTEDEEREEVRFIQ
jgi:hypothetical protein